MLIYLMVLHFVADFLLQSREMGKKKSSEFVWLLRHLLIQGCVMYAGLTPFLWMGLSGPKYLLFPLMNLVIHGIIDWNIWNLYKYSAFKRGAKADGSWQYWEDHLFYVTIGFDQLLHSITIIVLWNVL